MYNNKTNRVWCLWCMEITKFVVVEDHLNLQCEGESATTTKTNLHIQHIKERWFCLYIF